MKLLNNLENKDSLIMLMIPNGNASSAVCCKVNLGVGISASSCDTSCTQSGACDLRLALNCAVLSTTIAACPDKVVSDIQMNDTTNDPVNGDDDHSFYLFGSADRTLGHSFSWTCNESTDSIIYSDTITGEVPTRSPRAMCSIQSFMCKDVVGVAKEACPDGRWLIVGLGGGFKLNQVEGGTGVLATDNNNTVVTMTGAELTQPWCFVDAGTTELTTTLIDSITNETAI